MQTNASALEKKAIKLALQENWQEAIQTNLELLELDSNNLNAKMRLGKAYLQLKEFGKAEKIFKEVLQKDTINQIARKNYELAKSKKINQHAGVSNNKSMLKEPGITEETTVLLTAPRITANSFSYGTEFKLKILKTKVGVLNGDTVVGNLEDEKVVRKLNLAVRLNARIKAYFIRGQDKVISILIRSSEPVFKGDKQDIKPYLKKGSIEEPEIEVESFDDE